MDVPCGVDGSNVQIFHGSNTEQISRDMGRCILHLLFFGAFSRCINGGRAITQFPRVAHAAKWAIISNS